VRETEMKKKALLSGLILASMTLGNLTVLAAEDHGDSAVSDGTITWTYDDDGDGGDGGDGGGGIIDPIDPEEPGIEEPGDGDGDGDGSGSGPLQINYASKIDFGTRKISGKTETYHANFREYKNLNGEDVLLPTFVQVTDNRGMNDGWELNVTNSDFVDHETGDKLEGAVLTLGADNKVLTQNENGTEYKVSAKGNIILNGTNSSQNIVSKSVNNEKGMGKNTIAFGTDYGVEGEKNDAVQLEIPGKSKKNADATYVSELTWSLSSAEA
jgi:hypothetical protein